MERLLNLVLVTLYVMWRKALKFCILFSKLNLYLNLTLSYPAIYLALYPQGFPQGYITPMRFPSNDSDNLYLFSVYSRYFHLLYQLVFPHNDSVGLQSELHRLTNSSTNKCVKATQLLNCNLGMESMQCFQNLCS